MTKLADLPNTEDISDLMKFLIDNGQTALAWKYYYREVARTVLAIRKSRLDRAITRSMQKHRSVMLDVDHSLLIAAMKARQK